jgi:hypothetical protein
MRIVRKYNKQPKLPGFGRFIPHWVIILVISLLIVLWFVTLLIFKFVIMP